MFTSQVFVWLSLSPSSFCFSVSFLNVCVCLVTQLCLTLCDPMDCSPLGSSVYEDSPGKNTGMGCHSLFQGIFPTQGLSPGLPHWRQILYSLSHQGSPLSGYSMWKLHHDSLHPSNSLQLLMLLYFLCFFIVLFTFLCSKSLVYFMHFKIVCLNDKLQRAGIIAFFQC